MKAHELAELLLKCENLEVTASIDISTNDDDSGRRIFADNCRGINNYKGDGGNITILMDSEPYDNEGRRL